MAYKIPVKKVKLLKKKFTGYGRREISKSYLFKALHVDGWSFSGNVGARGLGAIEF